MIHINDSFLVSWCLGLPFILCYEFDMPVLWVSFLYQPRMSELGISVVLWTSGWWVILVVRGSGAEVMLVFGWWF